MADLRSASVGNMEAERLLSDRLLSAGYFDAHADRYPRRFALSAVRVVEVDNDFPRLTPGRVPSGILKARYEIDLDRVPGEDVSVAGALKRLGVL